MSPTWDKLAEEKARLQAKLASLDAQIRDRQEFRAQVLYEIQALTEIFTECAIDAPQKRQ